MRLLLASLVVLGCTGGGPGSTATTSQTTRPTLTATPSTKPTRQPTQSPTPGATPVSTRAATAGASLLPLPNELGRIPTSADSSVELTAVTPPDELTVGEARNYELAHCGLLSPVDIDGSFWDPVGGHNGQGGPLTEDQMGDLINATPTVVVLTDEQTMEMQTSHGAVITLIRHEGPRRYLLCA